MTRISYIHGIESIPKVVNDAGFDIAAYSTGELYLLQVKRRFEILRDYYGDPDKSLQRGITQLENAMTQNIQSFGFLGIQPSGMNEVNQAIQYAKSIDEPAFIEFSKDQKFQSFGLTRTEYPALPPIDRVEWIREYLKKYNLKENKENSNLAYQAYITYINFRSAMSRNWENVGHHILYEFVGQAEAVPAKVTTKSILHAQAIEIVSKIARGPRETVRLWTENGIMKNNAKQGIAPLTGTETIGELKESSKIGGVGVVEILKAVTAAVAAATLFVTAVKSTPEGDYMNAVTGFSTPSYGPESGDFFVNPQTNNASNLLPYLLIGGGALYLLSK